MQYGSYDCVRVWIWPSMLSSIQRHHAGGHFRPLWKESNFQCKHVERECSLWLEKVRWLEWKNNKKQQPTSRTMSKNAKFYVPNTWNGFGKKKYSKAYIITSGSTGPFRYFYYIHVFVCVCVFCERKHESRELILFKARRASPEVRSISFHLAHNTTAIYADNGTCLFLCSVGARAQQEQVFVLIEMHATRLWKAGECARLFAMRTHEVQCINEYQRKNKLFCRFSSLPLNFNTDPCSRSTK